jgi:ureidoglycolate lyase
VLARPRWRRQTVQCSQCQVILHANRLANITARRVRKAGGLAQASNKMEALLDMVSTSTINAVPISREAYTPYGSLIAADDDLPFKYANMGTAKRFDFLADVANLRDTAKLNLCVFRCCPLADKTLQLKLLEKHQYSTQVFMPMTSNAKFLVVVCLGGDTPDLKTLKVFVAGNGQGISYKPGVWHYPMTAIGEPIDFACLVGEDGTKDDCEVFNFDTAIEILSD